MSPLLNPVLAHTSILFFINTPVFIVPVTTAPVGNHAMIIGLDIYIVWRSAHVI
jgi:hypothetical protein